MPTVLKTYATEQPARQAVEALMAADVAGRDIRRVKGRRQHDTRLEPVGGFAGPVSPHAPVGRFAGRAGQRGRGAGSFVGVSDRQRQGSFGDVDRYFVVAYADEVERSRVAGEREVRRLLQASCHGEQADRIAHELELGRTVVLVEVAAGPTGAKSWAEAGASRRGVASEAAPAGAREAA